MTEEKIKSLFQFIQKLEPDQAVVLIIVPTVAGREKTAVLSTTTPEETAVALLDAWQCTADVNNGKAVSVRDLDLGE